MTSHKLAKKQLSKNDGFAWFPFDVVDWLTSNDVRKMTCAERGVYITLLAIQWRDGPLPSDLQVLSKCTTLVERTLNNFLTKFPHLFNTCPTSVEHLLNAKLWNLSVEVGKVRGPKIIDKNKSRGEVEGEEIIFVPRKRGKNKTTESSVEPVKRWPGDPDPDCLQCHGRGNWVEDGTTVGCPCTAEE